MHRPATNWPNSNCNGWCVTSGGGAAFTIKPAWPSISRELQTDRVYQTVANQVAVAYYQVLRVRSLRRIADKQVSRASDDLDVAKKLAQGGVVEREKVLRAQVALAQAQQAVDQVEEAEGIALAGLNLAIGLNVNSPTTIVDTSEIPPLTKSLEQCLQSAVFERREFQVARKSVQVAQEGTRVARADFAPRIVAEGYMNDLEQTNHGGRADLGLGFIRLEWGLFEGGKRIAEMDISNSRVREAMAEADSIADNIAFQVNQAYRQAVAARKGIDRSQPAIDQTLETYRLVVAQPAGRCDTGGVNQCASLAHPRSAGLREFRLQLLDRLGQSRFCHGCHRNAERWRPATVADGRRGN